MNESSSKLTVYFDDPFWVGVFERIENGKLSVCKVTFVAEPKDCEVWAFVLKNYSQLKFSPSVNVTIKKAATIQNGSSENHENNLLSPVLEQRHSKLCSYSEKKTS